MRTLTIGGLARQSKVNIETIRYYERIKLMKKADRTDAGHRTYGNSDVQRLVIIRRAREIGFSTDSIRALLSLAEPGRISCGEAQQIAATHLANVRAKLTDLARLERTLATTVTQCSTAPSLGCPVIDMLSDSRVG